MSHKSVTTPQEMFCAASPPKQGRFGERYPSLGRWQPLRKHNLIRILSISSWLQWPCLIIRKFPKASCFRSVLPSLLFLDNGPKWPSNYCSEYHLFSTCADCFYMSMWYSLPDPRTPWMGGCLGNLCLDTSWKPSVRRFKLIAGRISPLQKPSSFVFLPNQRYT